MDSFKKKFDYIYDNYGNKIVWTVLGLQALIVAITSYQ